ncbi:MAG: hypothetical protein HYU36_09090 [Planctomycetes bacterium]|nr:hypothetical protein [Planctomycetota bacterium]
MKRFELRVALWIGLGCSLCSPGGSETLTGAPALLEGNQIGNPGFEYDWHNNQAEGHALAFMGDWSFNASDLKPDYWSPTGGWALIEGEAHSGERSLRLDGGASVSRMVIKAAVNAPPGGGDLRWGNPNAMAIPFEPAARLARTVRASVWYRSRGLGGKNRLVLEVESCHVKKAAAAEAPAPDWARLDLELSRAEIEAAHAAGQAKGVQHGMVLSLRVEGDAPASIDDVSLSEDLTSDPNLAVNPGFEEVLKSVLPRGWTGPHKYTFYTQQYYKWTSWYHFFSPVRGSAVTTDLVAHSGQRSLLMQVFPGDEMLIEGEAIKLNQKESGIIEVGAHVLLDRVKWIDIRALDENGKEIPCVDAFTGGWLAPPDANQWYPSNAAAWVYIRKTFFRDKPLESIRPRLCARGFNGDTRDDAGSRPQVNQVGLAWWDDVRVCEVTATEKELRDRRVAIPQEKPKEPQGVMLQELDLGDRLYGDNTATMTLHNPTGRAKEVEVSLALLDAGGAAGEASRARAAVAAHGAATVRLPYRLAAPQMRGRWSDQGRLQLEVAAGRDLRSLSLAYNTWPVIVDVDFSRHYPTPDENPQVVAINLGVARDTLVKTRVLLLETCRRRDGQVVETVRIDDLAKALADTRANLAALGQPQFGTPSPAATADRRNLLALQLDLSRLPVHPFDHPVRDHVLRVRGLDAAGQELFSDTSQPFGRVQPNSEVLPKITKTEVREDGAVLINGQPVFLMAGNGYTQGQYALGPAQIKKQGFNCVRWVENVDGVAVNWQDNLYSLETMVRGAEATEANVRQKLAEGKLDGAVTLAQYYEHSSVHEDAKAVEADHAYTRLANSVAQRISNWGGGGAHNVYTVEKVFDAYDSFGLENEPFGPPRGGYELAPVLRRGRKAWFHLPQSYPVTPFEQFRFDQYAMVLQGGRGFSTIHGLGDPSLMRGITGEIRALSPAIFSLDGGDTRTAVSPDLWWMQRRVGNTVTLIALSKPAVEIGRWTWREDPAAPDRMAHTGVSEFSPVSTPDGLRLHGFREAKPVMVEKGDRLVQYVWLDRGTAPASIAWGVRGDGKWDFNAHYGKPFDFNKWRAEWIHFWLGGELLSGTWMIGWQYTDQTRDWFADHILNAGAFKTSGPLPEQGKWARLEISADEIGLAGKQVDGFLFLAREGEAWWAHSAIARGDREKVFCGRSLGPSREELAAVRFSVPWAADGIRVKVLFEERDLAVKDGGFTDDFRGIDTYQAIRGGAVGDAIGWHPLGTAVKGQTLGYLPPSGPADVFIYEINLGGEAK